MNVKVTGVFLMLLALAGLSAPAAAAPGDEYHYTLKRAVYRLELVGTPLARILCTVRDDVSGASDTVVWDPVDRRSSVRYALLPSRAQLPLSQKQAFALARATVAKLVPRLLEASTQQKELEEASKELAQERAGKADPQALKKLNAKLRTKSAALAKARQDLERALEVWLADGLVESSKTVDADAAAMTAKLVARSGDLSAPLVPHADVINDYLASHFNRALSELLGVGVLDPVVACRSEQRVVDGGRAADTVLWYLDDKAGTADPERSLTLAASGGGGGGGVSITVKFQLVTGEESKRVLAHRNDGVQTSRLRSLDPTTALATDALTALATVALERADDAGKEYARRAMREFLCEHLTVGEIIKGLKGSVLARTLEKLPWPPEQHLLRNTCALIDTLRIDELVSAKDAIWKAVGIDASALASAFLGKTLSSQQEEGLTSVLGGVTGLVNNALTSGSTTSERDAQVLLLTLARIGIPKDVDDRTDQQGWRYAVELGMAVLQECLRAGECSADELERLLDQEIELAGATSVSNWAELPAILGRAASVLRPPPGTSPATTAANAILVVLDVVERALGQIEIPGTATLTKCLQLQGGQVRVIDVADCRRLRLGDQDVVDNVTMGLALIENIRKAKGGSTCIPPGQANWVQTHLQKSPAAIQNDARNWAQPSACISQGNLEFAAGVLTTADSEKILDAMVNMGWKRRIERALGLVRTLRGVAAAMQGSDVTPVVVDLGKVLETAITDECQRQGEGGARKKCQLPITSAQLRKGFRILSALAAYGASYRKPGAGEDSGELEKLRAEEREKAIESLIDSVTDRSERYRDMVLSLGANVAITAERRWVPDAGADYWNRVPLSMPIGIAFQWLPNEGTTFLGRPGAHVMLSVLDLTQYATVGGKPADASSDDDLEAPEPEFGTALRLGLETGLILGEPSYPITACLNAAWIPHVNYGGDERDEWSFGASVGVFIPFIDFN